jgi:hypothetical protein
MECGILKKLGILIFWQQTKMFVHYEILFVLRHQVYFNLGFFQSCLLLTARYEHYISPKSYVARSASNTKFKQNRLVFLEMEHAGRLTNSQYTCILWVDCF